MKIKIDPADRVFSQAIRIRDRFCVRCGSPVRFKDGLPVSHQNSHYHGRGKRSTRFDPLNCDTLCHGCHQYWGSADKEGYRNFKIKQLGKKGFDDLCTRAEMYCKKDKKLELLFAKEYLNKIKKSR